MEIELPFIPDRVDLLDFETGIGYRYEKKDPERSKREDFEDPWYKAHEKYNEKYRGL